MRLLSFSHDANLYGAQRSLLILLAELRRRGHDARLVLPAAGELAVAAAAEGVPLEIRSYPYPSTRPGRALTFLRQLHPAAEGIRQLVREVAPDLVHFNTGACIAPAWALRHEPLPRIWHLRETVPMRPLLANWIVAWSDAVIANCRDTAQSWPGITRRRPIDIVYNGLDIRRPDEDVIARTRTQWAGPDQPLVVFAGQLRPHKDPMAVIEVASRLAGGEIKARFLILGDGPLRRTLQREIIRRGCEGIVTLAGFRPDAIHAIAAADVVFIPSRIEPFPRVGLEAMALQRCILASRSGGITEQIIDGESGLLADAGDYDTLAACLQRLLADASLRAQLAQGARRRFEEHFTLRAYADSFLEVANTVAGSTR